DLGLHLDHRHAGEIIAYFVHQQYSEFLVRHLAAAKLQLHGHFVPAVEKLLTVANLGQIIVLIDVYAKLDLFEFRAARSLVLVLLRKIVAELSERNDFADGRVRGGRDLDQIESATLRFTQG